MNGDISEVSLILDYDEQYEVTGRYQGRQEKKGTGLHRWNGKELLEPSETRWEMQSLAFVYSRSWCIGCRVDMGIDQSSILNDTQRSEATAST